MKLVEQVARAIYATDNGGIADRHPDGWIDWLPEARAALSVLAANVSDEMVKAAEDNFDIKPLGNWSDALRRAISAALAAAGDEDRSDLCAEANAFAMELLMPEFLLRPELEKLGGIDIEDSKAISKLAAKFRVSTQMMTLRLGERMIEMMAKKKNTPSPTQIDALTKARDDGPLKRIPGGFWVEQSHNGMIYQGGWYLGTPTIEACERRGWLEPCGDFPQHWRQSRRITDAGRAILSAAGDEDRRA